MVFSNSIIMVLQYLVYITCYANISYCGVQKESMNSHGTFNGEDYPLHVQLDNRTQTNGTVYVEQLKSFDFHQRKWQFIEIMPADLFEEIQKKVQLVIK